MRGAGGVGAAAADRQGGGRSVAVQLVCGDATDPAEQQLLVVGEHEDGGGLGAAPQEAGERSDWLAQVRY
jgi:hypothetical protein